MFWFMTTWFLATDPYDMWSNKKCSCDEEHEYEDDFWVDYRDFPPDDEGEPLLVESKEEVTTFEKRA